MSSSSVVPGPLGCEVRHDLGGVDVTEPVVGIGARDTVLGVLEGALGRLRRTHAHGLGHTRHHTAAAGAAALALLCSAALAGLTTPATAAQDEEPVTFTVGLVNEVDSFNPFLGIEAESFEMWALTYDYLISYSMENMSPEPGLATEWDTSDDGLTSYRPHWASKASRIRSSGVSPGSLANPRRCCEALRRSDGR